MTFFWIVQCVGSLLWDNALNATTCVGWAKVLVLVLAEDEWKDGIKLNLLFFTRLIDCLAFSSHIIRQLFSKNRVIFPFLISVFHRIRTLNLRLLTVPRKKKKFFKTFISINNLIQKKKSLHNHQLNCSWKRKKEIVIHVKTV